MSRVKIITPRTVTLEFRQEPGDPDYGSCLWAVFNLDLEAYGMTVLSDCGSYGYGWVPTPKSESFLHLLARLDASYLLDKISSRSVIDEDATFRALGRLMEDQGVDPDEPGPDEEPVIDMGRLREACLRDTDQEVHDAVTGLFKDTHMEDVDDYDVWCCIEKDFPLNAKKIAHVFHDHVAPVCAKLDAERASGKEDA